MPARLAPQDLALLRLPSDARVSPDGKHVVFVESALDLKRDTYRRGLRLVDAGGGKVETWTDGAHADQSPAWLPDSRQIVFVSDRAGASGLWRLRVGGREPQLLVQFPGRLRAPRPSPDGRRVAFLYVPPGSTRESRRGGGPDGAAAARFRRVVRHDFKHDGRGFRDGAFVHLWVLDLDRRGSARQLTFGDWDDGAFDWSPNGRRLVFESNRIARADIRPQNSDLHVVPATGGRARALTRFHGPKHSPAWSPNGRWIAFVGHTRFPDTVEDMHVWVVPATGGKARDVMAGVDLDCNDSLLTDLDDVSHVPPSPVWSADGKRLFALASRDGATNIWEVALGGGAPQQRSHGRHGLRSLSQSRDGRRWAFVRRDAVEPGDVWVATASADAPAANGNRTDAGSERSVAGARLRRLTRNADALHRTRRILVPQPFHTPSPAGHTLHGWILRAPNAPRRGPLVLMIHGGPYAMYGWSFMHEFQVLAQHGYHVAFVNLRGSSGYGREYMRALVGAWGSRDFEDLMRVTDVLERLPFVDPRRMAVAGGSYGGYLTTWSIAHTRRFAAAVAMRGVYDLPSMFGTSDIGPELLTEFEGQAPWDSIDRWWRVSPVAHAAQIRTPLLLLHAEEDHRCPVSQAEEMFTALRLLDRDVEFVRFLGDSHDLSRSGRPHNRVAQLRILLDWFDRKL